MVKTGGGREERSEWRGERRGSRMVTLTSIAATVHKIWVIHIARFTRGKHLKNKTERREERSWRR